MKTYRIFLVIIVASFLFTPLLCAKEHDLAAEALFSFGKAFLMQQRYTEAKQEFYKCLMLNPQHKKAQSLLELCERKMASGKDMAILLALEAIEKKSKAEAPVKITQGEKTLITLKEPEKTAKEKETPPVQTEQVTEERESLAPPVDKGAWTQKKASSILNSTQNTSGTTISLTITEKGKDGILTVRAMQSVRN